MALTIGLAALAFLAYPDSDATIENNIRTDLARQGLVGLDVKVSGREVHLSGVLPAGAQGDFAVSLARAAVCPAWFGSGPCATHVTSAFTGVPAARSPTPAVREITVPAPRPVRAAPDTPAAPCAAALARALGGESLGFALRSPELDAAAQALLDRLAQALSGCDGALRIEGHTDSRGTAQANRQLSLARALAVRDALVARGIPAARLQATGLGADQPRFDNTSADGRRLNRRIEFVATAPAALAERPPLEAPAPASGGPRR